MSFLHTTILVLIISLPFLTIAEDWQTHSSSTNIRDMAKEKDTLWLATAGGLGKLNTVTGDFNIYTTDNSDIPFRNVYWVVVDSSGNKWLRTTWAGRSIIKFDGNNWTVFDSTNSSFDYHPKAATVDKLGNLWVDGHNSLQKFDGEKWHVYDSTNTNLPSYLYIYDMVVDKDNLLYIRILNGDIITFDGKICDTLSYNLGSINTGEVTYSSIVFDSSGNIWANASIKSPKGWYLQNLLKYDGESWTIIDTTFTGYFDIDSSGALWVNKLRSIGKYSNNNWTFYDNSNLDLPYKGLEFNIIKVLIDENDVKWFATECGLIKCVNDEWSFVPTTVNGLMGDKITSIAIDCTNAIWVGTNYGLCFRKDDKWERFDSSNSALPANRITALTVDKNNSLFVGAGEKGLLTYKDGQWSEYFSTLKNFPDSLINCNVSAVLGLGTNDQWFVTNKYLINYYDDTTYIRKTDIFANAIMDFKDSVCVWVATDSTLSKYYRYTQTIDNSIKTSIGFKEISGYSIGADGTRYYKDIEVDNHGDTWVSYSKGMMKNGKLANVDTPDLLNNYYSIAIDSVGNKWVGTPYSLLKYDSLNATTTFDALKTDILVVEIDRYGNKWLGTNDGTVAMFNENDIVANSSSQIKLAKSPTIKLMQCASIVKGVLPFKIDEKTEIYLYNLHGQRVKKDFIKTTARAEFEFNKSTIARGTYILSVKSNSGNSIFTKLLID